MYYRTCSLCHSNLDPNEKCDCETKKETNPQPRERPLSKVSKVSLAVPQAKVNKVRGCLNG
jgi:hypothetical protein